MPRQLSGTCEFSTSYLANLIEARTTLVNVLSPNGKDEIFSFDGRTDGSAEQAMNLIGWSGEMTAALTLLNLGVRARAQVEFGNAIGWEVRSENVGYACQCLATNNNERLENKGLSNQKVILITQRSRVQIPPPQPFRPLQSGLFI